MLWTACAVLQRNKADSYRAAQAINIMLIEEDLCCFEEFIDEIQPPDEHSDPSDGLLGAHASMDALFDALHACNGGRALAWHFKGRDYKNLRQFKEGLQRPRCVVIMSDRAPQAVSQSVDKHPEVHIGRSVVSSPSTVQP